VRWCLITLLTVFLYCDRTGSSNNSFNNLNGWSEVYQARTMTSGFLNSPPVDILHRILSFLSLEELGRETRLVSTAFRDKSDTDPRWIPVIAPPSLAHEVLDIQKHGRELRYLYFQFLRFRKWWEAMDESNPSLLLTRRSHLDGFFSLAPWGRPSNCTEDVSYLTPWLHRMVYDQPCPTESKNAAPPPRLDPNHTSVFFQQRVRLESCRLFTSTPIDPKLIGEEFLRRVVLQPVNFRKLGTGA
jgi:hypothetical protein